MPVIAHSDPDLARRRARACSTRFHAAMVRFMIRRPPIQEELTRVLDDIFRGVLDDGERTRAEREPGMPPWTPEAQTDPLYEDLDPEDWHRVPYPPDLWAQEWRRSGLDQPLGRRGDAKQEGL